MSQQQHALDAPERLAALARTDLLDSPVEESFERYTRTLVRALGVPVALVSLVAEDRQFFKSSVGLDEEWAARRGSPLTHSFCQHVVADDAPLVVSDARQDPRVRDNLAIRDLDVVAYAGAPLHGPDGHPIGALCAIDSQPREWSEDDLQLVRELAAATSDLVAMRVAAVSRRAAVLELSHRLRSSLTGLRLEAEDLQAALGTGEPHDQAGRLLAGLDALSDLVEQSLTQAEGSPLGHEQDVDMQGLVSGVAARATPAARARGRDVVATGTDGAAAVRSVPAAVAGVLDGVVAVLLEHGQGVVELSVRADASTVRVRVQDEGGGLPESVVRALTGRSDTDRGAQDGTRPSLAEQAARSGGRLLVASSRPTTIDLLLAAR